MRRFNTPETQQAAFEIKERVQTLMEKAEGHLNRVNTENQQRPEARLDPSHTNRQGPRHAAIVQAADRYRRRTDRIQQAGENQLKRLEQRQQRQGPVNVKDIKTRAAEHVDRVFQARQRGMVEEHRRQEQRDVARRQAELRPFADNRRQAEHRYAQRCRTIEDKRQRIEDRMRERHNSVGGKIQAMTRGGKAKQAGDLQRLNERAEKAQLKAGRNYELVQARQAQAEQKVSIRHDRESRQLRDQHQQQRHEHDQRHQQTRPRQIEERVQALQRVEARNQAQERTLTLQQDFRQAQMKGTLAHTFNRHR